MSVLRIALAQFNPTVGAVHANAERMVHLIERARANLRAHVIIFPELALCGYPPEDLLLNHGFRREIGKALNWLQPHARSIDVIVGSPVYADDTVYNAAVVLRDGVQSAVYYKQELPNYGVFDEKRYFHAGTEPCVIDVCGVPCGITICEDVWVSPPVKKAADAGAHVIFNLNASPYHMKKAVQREHIVAERASDSGVPIVYVNQVGGQDELVFDGGSFVVDAQGEVIQRMQFFHEELALCTMDFDTQQVHPRAVAMAPHLHVEAEVYGALVLATRDYIIKNGFKGAVLGLSGGIDSALTLAIAVDAIGAANVEAVMMPSRYTSQMSLEDAAEIARNLAVNYRTISIEPLFEAFLASLADEFAGMPVDTTEENLQARCRGVLLMAISNKTGKLVLTTGNKSEVAVGYSTLYGDMAGGFDVLKDVPKTLVYQLCEFRNRMDAPIPRRIIERPPSAELAPNQKDQDSLPPYPMLDAILELYVEQDWGVEDIVAAGYDENIVKRIMRLVDRNEYKRRQAPPGVRITPRAFGKDRRYPITSGFAR